MKCNEVYDSIKELINDFEENHNKFTDKGNKYFGPEKPANINENIDEVDDLLKNKK